MVIFHGKLLNNQMVIPKCDPIYAPVIPCASRCSPGSPGSAAGHGASIGRSGGLVPHRNGQWDMMGYGSHSRYYMPMFLSMFVLACNGMYITLYN